jgi:hypothetical protein
VYGPQSDIASLVETGQTTKRVGLVNRMNVIAIAVRLSDLERCSTGEMREIKSERTK